MSRSFEELVAEADAADMHGWDFAWLDGRATEERPPWGYAGLLAERMGRARASLDLQTGGGEILAGLPARPPLCVATEGWPANVTTATARLHPLGVALVAAPDEPPFPFGDAAFDLVSARHPVRTYWEEVARVLAPGGTFLAQEVGSASVFELVEHFLGPQPPEVRGARDPERARAAATAAGLEVIDLRTAALRTEFFDVGAVVWFLRKVIWMVPGFTSAAYEPQLRALHATLSRGEPFVATTTRFLIEARKPASA
jgi:SAM-dependent methyltransferase